MYSIRAEYSIRKIDSLLEELLEKEKNLGSIIQKKINEAFNERDVSTADYENEIKQIKRELKNKYKKLIANERTDLEHTKEQLIFLDNKLQELLSY
jgi:dynactin complex subunit